MTAGRLPITICAVVFLSFGASSAKAQKFRVVGFGDSVTHAVGFDVGGGSTCNAGNPDTCGYLARLAGSSYFDCASSGCEFANRGVPGEKTTEALTNKKKTNHA